MGRTPHKLKFGEALQRSKSFRQGEIASMLGKSSYGTQFLNKLQRDTIFETAFTDQRKHSREEPTFMTIKTENTPQPELTSNVN